MTRRPTWLQVKPLGSILEDAARPEYRLNRAVGPVQVTLLGIGAIVGAGIFATIGTAAAGDAARPGAGPALTLSFLLTAVVCAFTALCYAELASTVPISGSAYTYAYATLGEGLAWLIGWDLIIEYAVGNIAVAISWANYFRTLLEGLGVDVPLWLSMDYRTAARIVDAAGGRPVLEAAPQLLGLPVVFNLPALAIVAALTALLVCGIRASARFNAAMVAVKVLVLAFFVAVGLLWVKPENWTPFAPNGWAGISAGAAIVFFAYIGFDAVSTVAEETRNPRRDLPIGILASLAVCTLLYVVVSAVFTGLISYDEIRRRLSTEQAEPLTLALEHAAPGLGWAVGIVAFGSVVAHTAVLLVFQLGQPRIFFSMARDGLLPPVFARVHPRWRTPHVSTVVTGAFVGGFAAVASLDEMVDLTNIGTLFAFALVCAGTLVLRVREPDRPRAFRAPGGPVLPVLGIASCLYLIYYLPPTSWMRFASWLNLGIAVYAAYGATHSRLTGPRPGEPRGAHDARTAELGAAAALAGVALVWLTRGLDLWIASWRAHAELHRGARAAAALAELSEASRWLEPSAFLILPLALHSLMLAPLLWRRAMRARRILPWPDGDRTRRSLGLVVLLEAACLPYLVLLAARWLPWGLR